MVEKTSAVGASSYSASSSVTSNAASQQEAKPNSIYTEGNKAKKAEIKPVPKPKPKRITITVKDGESLGFIAERYHTTVSDIVKLNGLEDPDKLKPGQKLQIDAIDGKQLEAYENYQNALWEQEWEQEQKDKLNQKIETSKAEVEKAKEYGYGEDYASCESRYEKLSDGCSRYRAIDYHGQARRYQKRYRGRGAQQPG